MNSDVNVIPFIIIEFAMPGSTDRICWAILSNAPATLFVDLFLAISPRFRCERDRHLSVQLFAVGLRTFQFGAIVFFDAVDGRNTAQSLSDGKHFFRPVWHVPFLERFLDLHQSYLIADFESKLHVAPFANVFSVKCSPYVLGIEISDQNGWHANTAMKRVVVTLDQIG